MVAPGHGDMVAPCNGYMVAPCFGDVVAPRYRDMVARCLGIWCSLVWDMVTPGYGMWLLHVKGMC